MCDRPCESGGSAVQAEDGSTTALGVLESVQPLRKAGSVGMQRTGLMHVGWAPGQNAQIARDRDLAIPRAKSRKIDRNRKQGSAARSRNGTPQCQNASAIAVHSQ